ncbi:MAG: arylesterase [Pseudobdellovibrio sp.]
MKTASIKAISFNFENQARVFFFLIFIVTSFFSKQVYPNSVSTTSVNKNTASHQNTRTIKLVILGDSLTEGYGVAQDSSFPYLLQNKFNKLKPNVKVISSGSSGSTSASALQRIKWISKDKPDYVLILLGSNDGLRGLSVAQTEKNLTEAVVWAKSQNIKVALGQLHVPPNYSVDYGKKFSAVYTNISRVQKINLAPFLLDKVAGNKDLNLADGIHPNEEGHKIVADNLFHFLAKWVN